jgi:hypothetical protein
MPQPMKSILASLDMDPHTNYNLHSLYIKRRVITIVYPLIFNILIFVRQNFNCICRSGEVSLDKSLTKQVYMLKKGGKKNKIRLCILIIEVLLLKVDANKNDQM